MKPNINTMKLTLTTRTKAALLVVLYSTFLMSFSSFAAPKDTVAKANACCTTKTVAKVVDTPAAVKHTGTENTDPNAAPEMTNALAAKLLLQVAGADDAINYHFMTGFFQGQAAANTSACDALTDAQVHCAFFGAHAAQLSIAAPVKADRNITLVFNAAHTLEAGALPTEISAQLTASADKAISLHFATQYMVQ